MVIKEHQKSRERPKSLQLAGLSIFVSYIYMTIIYLTDYLNGFYKLTTLFPTIISFSYIVFRCTWYVIEETFLDSALKGDRSNRFLFKLFPRNKFLVSIIIALVYTGFILVIFLTLGFYNNYKGLHLHSTRLILFSLVSYELYKGWVAKVNITILYRLVADEFVKDNASKLKEREKK